MLDFARSTSILAAFALSICACSPEPQTQGQLTGSQVGILGGTEVSESDPIAAFTVGLYDRKAGSRCTGSLIATDTVLTAAHCVDPNSKELSILFAKELFKNGKLNEDHLVTARSFQRHPQYDPLHAEGSDTHDLAIIHFEGGLPVGFEPVAFNSDGSTANQPEAEAIFLAAGFGLSNGLFGTGGGILRKVQLRFRQMHSATEFETVQDSKGVCSGDSGGPLFQAVEGKLFQIGVASRVATKFLGCRGYAVYTRVDSYRDWISQTSAKLRE